MATSPGQSRNAMSDALTRLAQEAGRSDFFALLRQIEQIDGRQFGGPGGPDREPARLGQHIRLTFATRDVEAARTGEPMQVETNVLGLMGPEGPMPLYLTRWVMSRLSNRWFAGDSDGVTSDTAFRDFANVLQHRIIGLYWRAWADAQAEVHASRGGGPSVAIMHALAGLGMPGTQDPAHDSAKLRHATKLGQDTRSPERLVSYLADVVGAPVNLQEFVGHWDPIPQHQQSRLGGQFATLGGTTIVGERSYSRQNRAALRLGPLTFNQFIALLDDPARKQALRHAIRFAAGYDITFDIRLVLARAEVPAARLGESRLGRTTWVQPRRDRDADDLILSLSEAA